MDKSFFSITTAPYYICCHEYLPKFAGVRALYQLCHSLNLLGQEAYILGAQTEVHHLQAPILQIQDVKKHQLQNRVPIVVYPEVVSGNPYNMPHVVRWLLNKPGHLDGDETYSPEDILFTYSHEFVHSINDIPLLNIPTVNTDIFNNKNNPNDQKRSGTCFYANKYLVKGGVLTEHVNDSMSLCQDVKLSRHELAEILRRSEFLYCYEPSAIIWEALMCGCPVIMIPTDYTQQNVEHMVTGPGIANTPSDSDKAYAKSSVNQCQEFYSELQQNSWNNVDNFIKVTQSVFSERTSIHHGKAILWGDKLLSNLQAKATSSIQQDEKKNILPLWAANKSWLHSHMLSESKVSLMAERMVKAWTSEPSFHLIVVVNANEMDALAVLLDSLESQLYQSWGLTIISNIPSPEAFESIPANIEWIKIKSTINEEIENAVNEAQLDWVMQLIPGDELMPHALLSFAETIALNAHKHFIFSDEIVDDETKSVWFKPDFSIEYLRAYSFLGRSVIVSRQAFEAVEGYTGLAYVYATDLAFKVYESFGKEAFAHIPDVIYKALPAQHEQERLIENELLVRYAHLNRIGVSATVSHPTGKARFQTHYSAKRQPKVSIVIAHHNNVSHFARCLDELLSNTTYINYEVVVVDVMSTVEDLEDIYAEAVETLGERFIQIKYEEQLNYAAAINLGVNKANGELIVVLSPFAMTVNGNWLNEILPLIIRDDVGIVGSRIIGDENKILHAGGVFGLTNDVSGLYEGQEITDSGYMQRAHCIQEYTSISSGCFCIEKSLFNEVDGLCEKEFSDTKYLIMDLCHKVRRASKKVIWTPYSTVFQDIKLAEHSNGVAPYKNKFQSEIKLIEKWAESYSADPFYNINLSLRSKQPLPEVEIQCHWDVRFNDKPRVMVFPMNGSGVGEYRVIAPMKALAEQGKIELTWLPFHEFKEEPILPSLFELARLQPDFLYVQQMLSDVGYDFLKQVKQHTSIKIVFSLDDLVTNLPKMSDRKNLVFRDMRHRLRRTLALCEHTIVSTQPLAGLCLQYTDNVTVIPNRLESQRWLTLEHPESRVHRKPRVGWAGANQHAGDLALMTDVVKTLADQVDWIFMGMCPLELRPFVKEFHDYVSFNEYPQALANLDLDLALAPLEYHPFNEAKSNLRLLEYGIMGWAVIASDVYPYQQYSAPVTLVANEPKFWIEAIKNAIAEPDKIAADGLKLQRWVRQKFVLEENLADWVNIFTV